MKTMQSACYTALWLALTVTGCEKTDRTQDVNLASETGAISLVDEVYGLSQGLEMDGMNFTVRGWLTTYGDSTEYQLYNAAWDVFEPATRDGISKITLHFDVAPLEYWLGQYVNVHGRLVTEAVPGHDREVHLESATVVSVKIRDRQTIPYRINKMPNKSEQATPRKSSD